MHVPLVHFPRLLELRDTKDVTSLRTASSLLVITKGAVGHSYKGSGVVSICTGSFLSARVRSPLFCISISLMRTSPLSLAETNVQAIQSLQAAYYGEMSALIMFLWDYGEPTNYVFDRMIP